MSQVNPTSSSPINPFQSASSTNQPITPLKLPPTEYDLAQGESPEHLRATLSQDSIEWLQVILDESEGFNQSLVCTKLLTALKSTDPSNSSKLSDKISSLVSKTASHDNIDLSQVSIEKATPQLIKNLSRFSYIPFAVLYSESLNQQID